MLAKRENLARAGHTAPPLMDGGGGQQEDVAASPHRPAPPSPAHHTPLTPHHCLLAHNPLTPSFYSVHPPSSLSPSPFTLVCYALQPALSTHYPLRSASLPCSTATPLACLSPNLHTTHSTTVCWPHPHPRTIHHTPQPSPRVTVSTMSPPPVCKTFLNSLRPAKTSYRLPQSKVACLSFW